MDGGSPSGGTSLSSGLVGPQTSAASLQGQVHVSRYLGDGKGNKRKKRPPEDFRKVINVDRSHDGPWMSVMSRDGKTVYINRNVPDKVSLEGKVCAVDALLIAHEAGEYPKLQEGLETFIKENKRKPNTKERVAIYNKAHKEGGIVKEREHATQNNVPWKPWNDWAKGIEAKLEEGPYQNEPDDADLARVPGAPDDDELAVADLPKRVTKLDPSGPVKDNKGIKYPKDSQSGRHEDEEGYNPPYYDEATRRAIRDDFARSARGESNIPPYRRRQLIQTRDKARDSSRFVSKADLQTLYVNRPVLNAEEIIDWAKRQGFSTTLPPEDMHVTVAHSKAPVSWPTPETEQLAVAPGSDRSVAQFSGGATVLRFTSPELTKRWSALRNLGASWDWPDFHPHVTLTYNGATDLLSDIVPYDGPIVLGPEVMAPVNEDWKDDVVEKAGPTKDKDEVAYQDSPNDSERCGLCTMFVKPDGCTLVKGDISAQGWCEEFDAEVQKAYDPSEPRDEQGRWSAVGAVASDIMRSPKTKKAIAAAIAAAVNTVSHNNDPTVVDDVISTHVDMLSANLQVTKGRAVQMLRSAVTKLRNDRVKSLKKAHEDPLVDCYDRILEALDRYEKTLKEEDEPMEKLGARHSKKDQDLVQAMHDHAVSLGAHCDHEEPDGDEGGSVGSEARSGDAMGVQKGLVRIAKVDENLGMVFGYAIVCKVNGEPYYDLNVDLSGQHAGQRVPEHIPEETMLKACIDFMQTARVGNEMHKTDDKGTFVCAFPLTTDIAKAMGIHSNVTGLMVGFKPPPDMLAKFKDGTLTGFSIEGKRVAYQEHE